MILALLLALAIGFSLALLGSGGSIITLPILVYVARVPAPEAVGMSLAIVGGTTFVASLLNARQGQVHGRAALIFSAAGIFGALGGSQLTHLVRPSVLLLIFAGIMIAVALYMFRSGGQATGREEIHCRWPVCGATGLAVGLLTGFLGVGGGFLIVPALVFFGRLPLKMAIGTSLVVITVNSAAGIVGHLRNTHFDWRLTLLFLVLAVGGMLAGRLIFHRLNPANLRRWFAWFVLAVALFVVSQNWKTLF